MKKHIIQFLIVNLSLFIALTSCNDPFEGENFVEPTTIISEMSCVAYLEDYDATHSAQDGDYTFYHFIDLLKYTNYYNALRSSKTSVTVFVPCDAAIEAFLADRGVSSMQELGETYCNNFVQAHIVTEKMNKERITAYSDSVPKRGMADDPALHQFDVPNLLSGYLRATKGYEQTDVDDVYRAETKIDTAHIYINDQAWCQLDFFVETSNANLMIINSCIRPLCETMIEKLEEQGEYSIFAAAARRSGYDKIADVFADTVYSMGGGYTVTYPQFTCFAPTDEAFKQAGINSVDALLNQLGGSTDSLYKYVQYHFLDKKYTVSDFFKYSVGDSTLLYDTQLPEQVLTAEDDSQGNHILNRCARIKRSNVEARNGYIHKVDNWLPIWMPEPMKRTWDFCNNSDIINLVNSYGRDHSYGEIYYASLGSKEYQIDLSDDDNEGAQGGTTDWRTSFTYKSTDTKASIKQYRRVGYKKCKYKSSRDKTNPYGKISNDDLLVLNLGYAGWIQMKTPTLIKGKYRVTLHYASESTLRSFHAAGSLVKFQMDPNGSELLVQSKKIFSGMSTATSFTYGCDDIVLWDEIEFGTSCSHQLKATCLDIQAKTSANYHLLFDYIIFEPIQ